MGEDVKGTMENEVINEVTEGAVVNTEPEVMEEPKQETMQAAGTEIVQPKESTQPRREVWRHDQNSPYSPLYVPDQSQKKNNKITIAFVFILLLCLVGGMIFAVSKLVEAAVGEVSSEVMSWQENFDDWLADSEDFFAGNDSVDIWEEEQNDWDEYNDEFDYDDGHEYDEDGYYVPSPHDEYYVELADAVRDNLSYTVDKHEYTYFDEDESVGIYVEYVSVDGLKFDDKINDALEEGAMYYAKEFGSENVSDLSLVVVSYVTYMDEDILSVVVDERYTWGNEVQADLYCMNFDLKTGSLLYNTNIIDPSEELAEAFRDMNDYQNGYIEHVDEISDDDIADYFSDEDSLILFYTPVGLEIGFNYADGWVTATLKDYDEYLSRL